MSWSGDPIRDFERRDREQQRWLNRRPRCSCCGHHIQDENCYLINDEFVCPECLKEQFEKQTEDYME
jgi:formylmethanofuran dehydrogenase subunit E